MLFIIFFVFVILQIQKLCYTYNLFLFKKGRISYTTFFFKKPNIENGNLERDCVWDIDRLYEVNKIKP